MSVAAVPEHSPADAAACAGLAHVATASFLASRVAPSGGFFVALAGGLALARAGQRAGLRAGYGASAAATLQAVSIMGPARFGIPLTQALSAPLLGVQHARGRSAAVQIAVCSLIRLLDGAAMTAFYIWVMVGGLDAYTGTYEAFMGRIPGMPGGDSGALIVTIGGLAVWTAFASVVQVLVYRRGLDGWPAHEPAVPVPAAAAASVPPAGRRVPRFDPRAVTAVAIVAFTALIASTAWTVLGIVAGGLALAWATARAEREPVRTGLILTATIAGGVLVFGLVGGIDIDLTLRRTIRAALLVLVATWLRAAAGEAGLRDVSQRALRRIRRVPAASEAAEVLDRLGAGSRLAASGRALLRATRDVPLRPEPMTAAVLGWVAVEADGFEPDGARSAA